MKVAIVGAGEIGTFLAGRLTEEQIDVTVIDRDVQVLSRLQNTVDVAGVRGNATSLKDLQAAEIGNADLFIATTSQDETNLISCLLATEMGIPHKIAVTRYLGVRGRDTPLDPQSMGIDLMVNSSEAVNREILENLETTGASEVARFASGQIILIGYQAYANGPLCGHTVSDICNYKSGHRYFTVAGIVRGQQLLEHNGDTMLEPGDYLYFLSTAAHVHHLSATLSMETIKTRTAVIFGDNFQSQMLANSLLQRHFHVTMLAENEEREALLRNQFAGMSGLHVETGSGIEVRLLRRVKVPQTSVFLAVHRDDTANLTACLLAKSLGVGKTIATIKRNDLLPLAYRSGVDVNVAPRLATAKAIQKLVHENRVIDYRAVSRTNLEVVEVKTAKKAKALKAPLGQLKLPKGVRVGAIANAEGAFLPEPDYQVKAGDKVVALTLPEHLLEVEAMFTE